MVKKIQTDCPSFPFRQKSGADGPNLNIFRHPVSEPCSRPQKQQWIYLDGRLIGMNIYESLVR